MTPSTTSHQVTTGLAEFTALALIWGSSFLLTKIAVKGLTPETLVLIRMIAGAGVLLLVMRRLDQHLPTKRSTWMHLAITACLLYVIPQLLFAWALERVDSHIAGLINATIPLMSFVLALGVKAERHVTGHLITGLVIGIAGATVLFAPWDAQNDSAFAGQLACIAAAFSSATAGVYMATSKDDLMPVTRAASQLIVGTVVTTIVVIVIRPTSFDLSPAVITCALVLGVVGSGGAAVLFWRMLGHLGAVRSSMVSYVTPVVSVVLGVVFASEHLTRHAIAGGVLVITGVVISKYIPAAARGKSAV